MQIIERLYNYLKDKDLSAYEFERKCGLSNGYLNSRKGGSRGIGSEILEKIYKNYPDLNLIWLVTGDGAMIATPQAQLQAQLQAQPHAQPKKSVKKTTPSDANEVNPLSPEYVIQILQSQVVILNATVVDKSRIIEMLQEKLTSNETEGK